MTPAKLLIAGALTEVAVELRSIVALMDEYRSRSAMGRMWRASCPAAAATAQWWANEVRAGGDLDPHRRCPAGCRQSRYLGMKVVRF